MAGVVNKYADNMNIYTEMSGPICAGLPVENPVDNSVENSAEIFL